MRAGAGQFTGGACRPHRSTRSHDSHVHVTRSPWTWPRSPGAKLSVGSHHTSRSHLSDRSHRSVSHHGGSPGPWSHAARRWTSRTSEVTHRRTRQGLVVQFWSLWVGSHHVGSHHPLLLALHDSLHHVGVLGCHILKERG